MTLSEQHPLLIRVSSVFHPCFIRVQSVFNPWLFFLFLAFLGPSRIVLEKQAFADLSCRAMTMSSSVDYELTSGSSGQID
jgi:hypothetical protein